MLRAFGDYNEGEFLFLGNWGPPFLWLFGAIALALIVLTWLDLSALPLRRRVVLVGLRGLTLVAAITLLLEPALELKHVTRVKNHVVVLLDSSRSQTLETGGDQTRFERALTQVERLRRRMSQPSEDHLFEFFAFDSGLEPASLNAAATVTPDGDSTEILEALRAVAERFGRRELGGIVLISDGVDNGELSGRVERGEGLDADTTAFVEGLGVPIHTFATAQAGELRDVAIGRVFHDDFAFVRNAVEVEVDINVRGYESGTIPVTLRREGQPLQTREISLERGTSTYRVAFEFVPELLGKEIYSIDVPVREGEALRDNNIEHFVIKIIRDKIRILHVVGRPSWDVRYLRQLLKNNPNVDLISFFILRTNEDIQRAPQNEMALIPFPVQELFEEQLGSFDLVILQNFTFRPYRMRQYLPNLRDYVYGGGGFMMVGGEQSFASGGYAQTEVLDVLPVDLPGGTAVDSLVDPSDFRPQLTRAGQLHPITRLEFDRGSNQELWETLPEMPGTNIVLEARNDATVLATHPNLRAGGDPMPVLAVREVGEGRSLAMTFDGSWKWNFSHVVDGGNSRPYTSFWNSAIRWLIRDPALNLVQVEIAAEVYSPGEEVAAVVRVYNPDYSPADAVSGVARVWRRDLETLVPGQRGDLVSEHPFTTDARGRFDLRFDLADTGAYAVEAVAEVEAGVPLSDEEIFLGVVRGGEFRDIEPRPELLQALSEASGGRARIAPARGGGRLDFAPARVEQVDRRKVIDIWSAPWLLLAFVVILGLEWGLRRRWGRL